MFFDSWASLVQTVLLGILACFALVLLLRLSGRRLHSTMQAFDLVVTITLSFTLAVLLIPQDVTLLEGVAAFAVLMGRQFVGAWTSARLATARRLSKADPTLLHFQRCAKHPYPERIHGA